MKWIIHCWIQAILNILQILKAVIRQKALFNEVKSYNVGE